MHEGIWHYSYLFRLNFSNSRTHSVSNFPSKAENPELEIIYNGDHSVSVTCIEDIANNSI